MQSRDDCEPPDLIITAGTPPPYPKDAAPGAGTVVRDGVAVLANKRRTTRTTTTTTTTVTTTETDTQELLLSSVAVADISSENAKELDGPAEELVQYATAVIDNAGLGLGLADGKLPDDEKQLGASALSISTSAPDRPAQRRATSYGGIGGAGRDKPLPPRPHNADSLEPSSGSTKPSLYDVNDSEQRQTRPPVRRIKSFGDLLTGNRPSVVFPTTRRESHEERDAALGVNSPARAKGLSLAQDTGVAGAVRIPSKPRTLQKRASSLGFANVRRSTIDKENDSAIPPLPRNSRVHVGEKGLRTVSSSTAPASVSPTTVSQHIDPFTSPEATRRRKVSSGFSLIPSFLRSKPREKDAPTVEKAKPLQEPTAKAEQVAAKASYETEGSIKLDFVPATQTDLVLTPPIESPTAPSPPPIANGSPSTTPVEADVSNTLAASVTAVKPPINPPIVQKRSSFFPSFFRSSTSASATSPLSGPSMVQEVAPPAEPHATTPLASSIASPSSVSAPIPITSPQLPAIEKSESSFSSLFDLDKPKRGRGRASTNGSARSVGSGSGLFSASLPFSASMKVRASLQQPEHSNQKRLSLPPSPSTPDGPMSEFGILHHAEPPSHFLRDRETTPYAEHATTADTSQRTAAVEVLIMQRTRLLRSTSASSVPRSPTVADASLPALSSSLKARPLLSRSRSSSTASHKSPYSERATLSVPSSPAVTITPQQPFFDAGDGVARRSASPDQDEQRADGDEQEKREPGKLAPPSTYGLSVQISDGSPATTSSNASAIRFSTESAERTLPVKPSSVVETSSDKSVSMSRKLRRRSQTTSYASPSLAVLTTASSTTSSGPRTGRSNSSSRLSSFFSSSSSPFSSPSTTPGLSSATTTSSSWFSPSSKDSLLAIRRSTDNVKTGSSAHNASTTSFLGSPALSQHGFDDAQSSTSSLLNTGTTATFSNRLFDTSMYDGLPTPISIASSDVNSPALSQTDSSPGRFRSNSSLTKPTRASVAVEEDDTPASYVERLKEAVHRSEIATILAAINDPFHIAALRAHLADFSFADDPIDIALRKLLLGLHLPRETQQIDRVMEAFAERYNFCNPNLFDSPDTPYILAFSMIMLHTDAFNKSNKNKMTKADYVKNTRMDGVSPDLLEYIYDNITYAPFVYAADDELTEPCGAALAPTGSSSGKDRNRLDVYSLIQNKQTSKFRVDLGQIVPLKNPFSYAGTVAFFDCSTLHSAFSCASVLEIPFPEKKGAILSSQTSSLDSSSCGALPANSPSAGENKDSSLNLKIAKVGVLDRKDDLAEGGKKASSRKWKSWSVLLTASQLLLFKDTSIATALQPQIDGADTSPPQLSRLPMFKPDAVLSLNDSVALYDFTYARYTNVFRLLQPNGRQVLFRAEDVDTMNTWMSMINYAASFRSAGIRMRTTPAGSSSGPASHAKTFTATPQQDAPLSTENAVEGMNSLPVVSAHESVPNGSKLSTMSSISATSTVTSSPSIQKSPALSPGRTREDWTARSSTSTDLPTDLAPYLDETYMFNKSTTSNLSRNKEGGSTRRHHSRGDIVRTKIVELEERIKHEQASLASELRLVRNLAILTPFTAAARQRIALALQPVARRVRASRQSAAKLVCYREVLCRDLLASEREVLQRSHRQQQQQLGSSTMSVMHPSSPLPSHADEFGRFAGQNDAIGFSASANVRQWPTAPAMLPSRSEDEVASISKSSSRRRFKRSLTTSEDAPSPAAIAAASTTPSSPELGMRASYLESNASSSGDEMPLPPPRLFLNSGTSSPGRRGTLSNSPVSISPAAFETLVEEEAQEESVHHDSVTDGLK